MTTRGLQLCHHLGDGGMGSVWLGRTEADEMVAVKTLRADLASDPKLARLFLREMRIAAAIRHPNVVRVLSTSADHETPYFTMEWVDGASLRGLLRSREGREPLPLAVALRIVHDACAGLHAAHELRCPTTGKPMSVVHRDVSPHNLLLSRDGVTKIIDFGVATARQGIPNDTTSSGAVRGKVRYMAPEQARGGTVDRRADVFAIGTVLYELLLGRPAFHGPNDLAILTSLLSPMPVEIPSTLPPCLEAILSRSLAKRVEERFETAEIMREAIAMAMMDLDAVALPRDVAGFVPASPAFRNAPTDAADPCPTAADITRSAALPSRKARPWAGPLALALGIPLMVGLVFRVHSTRNDDVAVLRAPEAAPMLISSATNLAAPTVAPASSAPEQLAAPVGIPSTLPKAMATTNGAREAARPLVRKVKKVAAPPRGTETDLESSLRSRQ
jgi:eukaryotic-like serine/threonine-protein kinase